ncbi:MAG: molybdopterin-binding protein [Candidatus Riflebacteria bacterium]|nr:molybdopterin-binding protein [Candidatus Riflebacteria bacterium]
MKVSARNVLKGVVKSITVGAVNSEVIIEIAPGKEISSIITKTSCENLGLKVGKEAYAIIKASSVIIGAD